METPEQFRSAGSMKQRPEDLLLYLYQEGDIEERASPVRFAGAIRATDKSPFRRRLGKHGTRKRCQVAQGRQRDRTLPGRSCVPIRTDKTTAPDMRNAVGGVNKTEALFLQVPWILRK